MSARRIFPLPDDYASRALLAGGMVMFALFFVIAPAQFIDDRLLNGAPVWAKPMKFTLSLAVHFLTLAILAQLLEARTRSGVLMRLGVWSLLFAALFEIVYIIVQAGRGRHSHFNHETPFEALMYALMGVGALMLALIPLLLGVLIALRKDAAPSGLRLGAVLGLTLGPLLTIVLAGYMSMTGSHFVAAPGASDAGGLPLFGWSTEVADLRPAHFLATHLMQVLPAVGYLGDRFAPRLARPAVFAALALVGGGAAALFALAASGRPLSVLF